jgi:LCP family protein required for cell wall assembly
VVVAVVALLVLASGLALFRAKQIFDGIPRVPVSSAFTPTASGTNILIVGTDSRDGVDTDTPNAGAIIGEAVTGARTDSIMVFHQGRDGSQKLLSIPRDLWVTNPATGKKGRINSVYDSTNPTALVQAVTNLGIPIQRYAEINFVSFSELVNAVGGITIEFPHAARDTHSGLDVPQSGPVLLDGTQALAYVRSRFYEEQIDGRWRTDPTSDIGRAERQRAFLSALFAEIGSTRNPFALLRIGNSLRSGMRIDDTWSFWTALSMGWNLRGFAPESVALPVSPRTTAGGAAVLDLKPEASTTIAGFIG